MALYPFRIFISYSHEDAAIAAKACGALADLGLKPLWDQSIRPGVAFTDAIKSYIHHAHLFMPLITESASRRPWVHQETGYAMALNIPILPVAVSSVPGEMAAQLQAVVVENDLSDFSDKIGALDLEQIVLTPQDQMLSSVQVSDWAEKRTELLAKDARRVMELGAHGRVRQRALLSSFSIPDKDPSHPIWTRRDGEDHYGAYYHALQREERRALQVHAQAAGCDLIIDPDFCFERHGKVATQTRLQILVEFIERMPDDKLRIVITPVARQGNLTIVGDWFIAESMTPRESHRQSVFNWHAPSVLQSVRRFDAQFQELCAENAVDPKKSRGIAFERIKMILEQ